MERRKFERAAIESLSVVVFDESGQSHAGEASDLSIGGMFIEGLTAPFGARITIHTLLGGEHPLKLEAVVRWVTPRGIGVQFGLLGARETHAITEVVARAAPSRARLRAETEAVDVDLDELLRSG